ncbi:MAG TPA: hypothetical protein VHD83_20545 [Puia sp.]|nr:hypothetical protein [Puia sp.]
MFLTEGKYHFFFGDETSIRFFDNARKRLRFPEKRYIGVLEMEECYKALPEELGLLLDVVPHKGVSAEQAIQFLHRLEPELWQLWKDGIFHLAGRWNIIHSFQKELTRMGIPDERIVLYARTPVGGLSEQAPLPPVKSPDLAVKFPFCGL